MKEFFEELLEYTDHYNRELAAQILAEQGEGGEKRLPDRAVKVFGHMLNAHHIWNHRIEGSRPKFGVWHEQPLSAFNEILRENYQRTVFILKERELSELIRYANSNGQKFSNSLRNIVFHIINHSTYHRAQLATMFRESGLTPMMTEFVHYTSASDI